MTNLTGAVEGSVLTANKGGIFTSFDVNAFEVPGSTTTRTIGRMIFSAAA